jgi:hypothetical protein
VGARLGHQDDGDPADEYDPANLASELYQEVLTQIEALGLELIEVRRATFLSREANRPHRVRAAPSPRVRLRPMVTQNHGYSIVSVGLATILR